MATAAGLAASTGTPAVGVCTLDALASGLRRAAPGWEGDFATVLDARRGEAFAARYASSGERRWGPWVGPPEALARSLADGGAAVLACGSGALRFRDELEDRGIEAPGDSDPAHRVSAREVCALAAVADPDGAGGRLAPIYLRPPDAERWRERDTSETTG